MARRTSSRTTVVTSTRQPLEDVSIDMSLLREDEFEKRPKTDYTYSRSATYSNKYVDGGVVSPNLSRRKLYTSELVREQQSASLMKSGGSSSHVRVYGSSRRNQGGNKLTVVEDVNRNNSNTETAATNNRQSQSTTTHSVVYSTRESNAQHGSSQQVDRTTMSLQQSNNNSEAIFSDDEESMSRSTSQRKATGSAKNRSKSPRRSARATGRRRAVRLQDEVDTESSSSLEIGNRRNAGDSKKGETYMLSTGLDSELDSDLVTERSSTIIDTVATGTPFTAKLMGCILFIYGFMRILISRIWYNFGHPVYATLQRYLLLDSWLLSRTFIRQLRALIVGLFFLLLPLALLGAGVCSLHALGFVNVQTCAPLTNVYYVSKPSDLKARGFSVRLQDMLNGMFSSADDKSRTPPPERHTSTTPVVDWEHVIEARINALRSNIELQSNAEISVQKQKNTELETAIQVLSREVDDMKGRFSSFNTILNDLTELKLNVASLGDRVNSLPDYSDDITKIASDIRNLYAKLGNVDLPEDKSSPGILVYLASEISTIRPDLQLPSSTGRATVREGNSKAGKEDQLKTAIKNRQTAVPVPKDCPDSSCVCESELGVRLSALQNELRRELDEKGAGTTVYVTSDNSSGISEQFVKKMIQNELDIFAADKTGMPDFALQSMGAQVVSTRCSQTFYEQTGIMTYLGIPLFHLHKDPSVVIQPEVNPGECWCFHGQSGSLVIEMAERVKFNSFSLEHISASQSATGEILSAPQYIEVYGLSSELDTDGQKIGKWKYEVNGPRLQFFPVQDSSIPPYHVVELRVLSNWGQKEYTCLYRFRVHGKLAPK